MNELNFEEIYQSLTPFLFIKYAKKYLIEKGFVEIKQTEKNPYSSEYQKFFLVNSNKNLIIYNGNKSLDKVLVSADISSKGFISKPVDFDFSEGFCKVRCAVPSNGCIPLDRPFAAAINVIYTDKNGNPKMESFRTNYPVAFSGVTDDKSNLDDLCTLILSLDSSADFSFVQPNHSKPIIDIITKELRIEEDQIINFELHFIDWRMPKFVGIKKEYVTGLNIGYCAAAIATLHAISDAEAKDKCLVTYFYGGKKEVAAPRNLGEGVKRIDVNVDLDHSKPKEPCATSETFPSGLTEINLNVMANEYGSNIISTNSISCVEELLKEQLNKSL